jgi:sugar-specific transcriptional regulator TrmB
MVQDFCELGLTTNEAKVLVGLLRLGRGNTVQLAKVTGITRTTIYHVLEALGTRHLAERLPGSTPAEWTTPGREEVLERLEVDEEAAAAARLAAYRERTGRLREVLARSFPESAGAAQTYVHQIHGAAQVKRTYDGLLERAQSELLIFTRPPYSYTLGRPNPAVMDLLERGVAARALYQAGEWADPAAAAFRAEMEIYHQGGVAARLVEELPLKLVVVDRAAALLAMTDPVLGEDGFPTTLLIDHPAFAALQADAFELRWAQGRPLADVAVAEEEEAQVSGTESG